MPDGHGLGSDPAERLSRLERQRAALAAEVEDLRRREPDRLRARVLKTALVVGILAVLAAGAIYQFRSWFS
jgi:hypothetical protein